MEHSQMEERNKTMMLLVIEVEVEARLEVEPEDDFKEKIFQIYLTHFLGDDFREEDKDQEDRQKNEEKIWNMIYA
jgi:hypothetical protein